MKSEPPFTTPAEELTALYQWNGRAMVANLGERSAAERMKRAKLIDQCWHQIVKAQLNAVKVQPK